MKLLSLLRRRDRGVSALEFVLVAPVVVFITFAVLDFGNALQQIIRLETAARAGAQVAFTQPNNPREDPNDPGSIRVVQKAVRDSLQYWPLSPTGDVQVQYNASCMCPLPSTTTFDCFATAVEDACGTSVDDFRQFASVNVSRPYRALFIVPVTTLRGHVELRLR